MSVAIIQQKLLSYQCQTILEQENALKEIAQEIALMALSRAGFYKIAAFQGETCLRILYGLERFSEDLDFVLLKPDKAFDWADYIKNMNDEFNAYGYGLEIINKSKTNKAIKMAFLKAESTGGLLIIKDLKSNQPALRIKLEIDTHPPKGSKYELKYLTFPLSYSVQCQDLPSLFASKCHALLCRDYIKGRDWYDFIWYLSQRISLNFTLLSAALNQAGPWMGQEINVTTDWLQKALKSKIKKIDWHDAKQDVQRFLKPRELASLDVWSKDFFSASVDKLVSYL